MSHIPGNPFTPDKTSLMYETRAQYARVHEMRTENLIELAKYLTDRGDHNGASAASREAKRCLGLV